MLGGVNIKSLKNRHIDMSIQHFHEFTRHLLVENIFMARDCVVIDVHVGHGTTLPHELLVLIFDRGDHQGY